MPHSLRAKLGGLHHKQIISDKDYDRLCKALDSENVLDKIRAEIIENSIKDYEYHGCGTDELIIETSEALNIVDKYNLLTKCQKIN